MNIFSDPALEMAGGLETYGEEGEWAFLPVAAGFFLGTQTCLAARSGVAGSNQNHCKITYSFIPKYFKNQAFLIKNY